MEDKCSIFGSYFLITSQLNGKHTVSIIHEGLFLYFL
jgi:hypothetical protein